MCIRDSNQSARQIVVANNLEDITIINTEDAVYVGRTGESEKLKDKMCIRDRSTTCPLAVLKVVPGRTADFSLLTVVALSLIHICRRGLRRGRADDRGT